MNEVNNIDVSIIVCTYNRAGSLRQTLAALRSLEIRPDRQWEVIIVDNNSKDNTRCVVEEQQNDWAQLRYEFEPLQGLSHARNLGILSARGQVIMFTDDDVLPEPDWVENTLAGMEKHKAEACGGFIVPIWEVPPPPWLTERFYGFLAVRNDREDDYVIESLSQAPFGANMAFRKSVFNSLGLFDTTRGRQGKVLASGEDWEMFERILASGMKAVFLGKSRVHHKVEAFRLTKGYFRRWRFQTSRNLAISKGISGNRRLLNIPLYLFPQFLRATASALSGHLTQSRDEAFNREMIVCHFLGTFHGLWQARQKNIRQSHG